MSNVMLAGNGAGGTIRGEYGTYQANAEGLWTVNTLDAPALLAAGFSYVNPQSQSYATPIAPAAAAAGHIIASGALSNGAIAITNQPDVARQVEIAVGAGAAAITAGTLTVVYNGNDGQSDTDTFSLVLAASATATFTLSRGAVSITSVTVADLVGGSSPFIRGDSTTMLALPIAAGAVGLDVVQEYDGSTKETPGALSAAVLGGITPTSAPNATLEYSFVYSYVTPIN